MINQIKISNFKSINELELNLGIFNVLIGANGSGKSNILEAIAIGAAASDDKLDYEFLASRGIRNTELLDFKSKLISKSKNKFIEITFKNDSKFRNFKIDTVLKNGEIALHNINKNEISQNLKDLFIAIFTDPTEYINNNIKLTSVEKKSILEFNYSIKSLINSSNDKNSENVEIDLSKIAKELSFAKELYNANYFNHDIANYIIFNPEIESIRKFQDDYQIKPLGVNGEGLFKVLQFLKSSDILKWEDLLDHLHIIDWFYNLDTHENLKTGQKSLKIKDRYIKNSTISHTNVNEGFLFLLFYAALFLSEGTPNFFAIENLEAGLHPLVCKEMTKSLYDLATRNKKQVIITTHNPFAIDGLDLDDPNQKLYVIERNQIGETIARQVSKPIDMKLSEAWIRGIIGGNPETF